MLRYLLDTGTCIGFLSGHSPKIAGRLKRHRPSEIAVSALTLVELLQGARQSKRPAENLRVVRAFAGPLAVLPFDAASADVAARLRGETAGDVRGLAGWDLLLAAIAMQRALTMVTTEPRVFARVPGLAVEDWSA